MVPTISHIIHVKNQNAKALLDQKKILAETQHTSDFNQMSYEEPASQVQNDGFGSLGVNQVLTQQSDETYQSEEDKDSDDSNSSNSSGNLQRGPKDGRRRQGLEFSKGSKAIKKATPPTRTRISKQRPTQVIAAKEKKKSPSCLKLDVGFKSLLRGMRKYIRRLFDPDGVSRPGKHHWDARERWFHEVKAFMSEDLKIKGFSDKDVWALTLIIYHALGPSEKFQAHEAISSNLGEEGILIYKTIFDKNREYSRDLFL